MPPKTQAVYEDIYGSEYLSPEDLKPGQEVEVEFTGYEVRELFCRGKKNIRVTVAAKGAKKRICINKTSAKALAKAYGKDFAGWVGKPVTVRRGMVNNKQAILITPKGAGVAGDDDPESLEYSGPIED